MSAPPPVSTPPSYPAQQGYPAQQPYPPAPNYAAPAYPAAAYPTPGATATPPGYPAGYPAQQGSSAYPPGLGVPPVPAAPIRQIPPYLSGDWAGAARAVGIGMGAMFGMSLIIGLVSVVAGAGSFRATQFLSGLFQTVGMAAGGSAGDDNSSLYFRPLGLTIVGYTLLTRAFLQRLSHTGPLTARGAGLQAARLGVVHLGTLVVIALLSRVFSAGGGRGVHLEVFSTAFYGTVTLGVALLVGWIVALPALLPARIEHYRTLVIGPIKAMLWLIVASSAATLLLLLILVFSSSTRDTGLFGSVLDQSGITGGGLSREWRGLLVLIIAYLPTVAGWALLFGMGVPVTASGASESSSILDLVDKEPMFWLWPAATIAVLVGAGWYAAKRSPVAPSGRPIGWWLTAVLPLAMFVLALTASIRVDVASRGSVIGFDLLFVLLLGAIFGAATGWLGTVLVPRQAPMAGYATTTTYAAPPNPPS